MEPTAVAAALKVLSKVWTVGLSGYKVRQAWGLTADEASALASFVSGGGELVGMLGGPSVSTARLFATHTALATRAFATACREHWGGSAVMAPGLEAPKGVRALLLSKPEAARSADIEARMRRAMDRMAVPDRGTLAVRFDVLTDLVDTPLSSPCYRALWEAFTSPALAGGDDAPLIDLTSATARPDFERAYTLAYAEALTSPAGAEVARGMVALGATRAARLRELLVRRVSTWKRAHVFGELEAAGVPGMPLEEIYVEPDGVVAASKDGSVAARRAPVRQLVRELLAEARVVIVRGDFGQGKSLTARAMACEWAEAYLTDRTTASPDLVYPVFIRCGVDFANHEPSLGRVVARALRSQATALRIGLRLDDEAFERPDGAEWAVYLVDGLDEVALTPAEVDDFLKDLTDQTSDRQRAIVFSRKGVLPPDERLRGVPVVDLQPLRTTGDATGGQVGEWLERWNRASGRAPITARQLAARGLLEVVTTPIILFMTAMTWDEADGADGADGAGGAVDTARLYERFFRQIAAGKARQDVDGHQPVTDASRRLLARLVAVKEMAAPLPGEDEAVVRVEAMLWLMSRIAWEGQRRAQAGSDLSLFDVTAILRDELGLRDDPKAEELVTTGVLLALQADHHGGNDRILFGHKSFREFLVARYWAGQLRAIVAARHDRRAPLEKRLLGARLLGEGEGAFRFLVQLLAGADWDPDRGRLVEWASDCFHDERPEWSDPGAPSWLTDQRPLLREAALAIGRSLPGTPGMPVERPEALRSMLGWFWVAGLAPIVDPELLAAAPSLPGSRP